MMTLSFAASSPSLANGSSHCSAPGTGSSLPWARRRRVPLWRQSAALRRQSAALGAETTCDAAGGAKAASKPRAKIPWPRNLARSRHSASSRAMKT